MRYTIILRRATYLLDIFDEDDAMLYIANPDIDFGSLKEAVKAAKIEAAKADEPDARHILTERGLRSRGFEIVPEQGYQVIIVFEGRHEPIVTGPNDLLVQRLNFHF